MRLTNNMMVTSTIRNINAAANRLNEATERVSSEMKISLPSDDPVVATKTIKYRDYVAKIEQYQSNASATTSWQKTSNSSLTSLATIISDIYKNTNKAANAGALTDSDLADIKEEISSNLEEIVQLMNTDSAGRYIFGGYSTDEEPYALEDKSILSTVTATSGSYTGSNFSISDDLAAGTYSLSVALSGGTYTVTMSDGTNTYTGTTTSSTGTVTLSNASTGEVGATVTAPAAGFAVTDDVDITVGTTEVVTFKGKCLGTVISSDYSDAAITALYNGNTYTDSGSDESIKYNIGYNAEVVVNTEGQDVIGDSSSNLFNTLSKIIMALDGDTTYKSYNTSTGVSSGTLDLSSLLGDLTTDLDRVTTAQATLGARMNYVTRVTDRLGNDYTTYTTLLSDTIDVDITKASAEQSTADVVYEAALSVGAKAINKTLVDFMA